MAALAFMAGCGPQFMAARWPDEIAMWTRIAEAAVELREEELDRLARKIRNEITEAF